MTTLSLRPCSAFPSQSSQSLFSWHGGYGTWVKRGARLVKYLYNKWSDYEGDSASLFLPLQTRSINLHAVRPLASGLFDLDGQTCVYPTSKSVIIRRFDNYNLLVFDVKTVLLTSVLSSFLYLSIPYGAVQTSKYTQTTRTARSDGNTQKQSGASSNGLMPWLEVSEYIYQQI